MLLILPLKTFKLEVQHFSHLNWCLDKDSKLSLLLKNLFKIFQIHTRKLLWVHSKYTENSKPQTQKLIVKDMAVNNMNFSIPILAAVNINGRKNQQKNLLFSD